MIISDDGTILIKVSDDDIKNGTLAIPQTITGIGDDAFWDCVNLTHINLPDSITQIGFGAFGGCSNLTQINLPDSITAIGYQAFHGCGKLTHFNLPAGITHIGDWTFSGCGKLTHFNLPAGITQIGEGAFYNCGKLTQINLPSSITEIGDLAFHGCRKLTQIHLPDSITNIHYGAFWDCSKLTQINLPSSITEIGDLAFQGCDGLTDVIVDSDNETEIARIKGLLPESLHHKVISKTPYVWAQQAINTALKEITNLAESSRLYPSVEHGSLNLCEDMLTEISGFQGEDNQYYNSAKKEMDAIAMPKNEEQRLAYQDSLNNIVERHLKQAEDDAKKQEKHNERKQIEQQYLKFRNLFSFDKDNSKETYQHAFKEFAQQYSALNEEDLKHHILSFDKFHRCCNELTQKYSDFERRDEKAAINETRELLNTLQYAFINYVKGFKTANNKDALCDNLQMFKQKCQEAIDDARSGLEKHRGLKKILTNLAIAVLTLGVGLLIGGTINYALTGRFFFHPPTRTEKILNKTDRAIGDVGIPDPQTKEEHSILRPTPARSDIAEGGFERLTRD